MTKKNQKPKVPDTLISNCKFVGVEWDGAALETLHAVAIGLRNLTELFRSQNVRIDSMLDMRAKREK